MKLSEAPFETLMVGDRLISAIGTAGRIIKINRNNSQEDYCNQWITIEWDNGKFSGDNHENFTKVEYLGRE